VYYCIFWVARFGVFTRIAEIKGNFALSLVTVFLVVDIAKNIRLIFLQILLAIMQICHDYELFVYYPSINKRIIGIVYNLFMIYLRLSIFSRVELQ